MDKKITLYDYVLIYEYIGSLLKCQNLFNENVQYFILLLINDCYEAADYSNYLGADNLKKSLHFYRDGLGLPTEGIAGTEFEHGAAAFLTYKQD